MDRRTVGVYEARAGEWVARRRPSDVGDARDLARRVPDGAWRADLGCGPGWHAEHLGQPLVALDAAHAMLQETRVRVPGAALVQADIEALPFRRGSLGGAWAKASYLHVPAERLPMTLGDLHFALALGAPVEITVHSGRRPEGWVDEFEGRLFSAWSPEGLADMVTGAGFAVDDVSLTGGERAEWVRLRATRMRSLADSVGPGMRMLVVGLNPSEYAADAGVAFARPGNRFWPAAIAAGVVTRDRDARHALVADGVGLTDLVKRATPRAHWLSDAEYRAGAARVERLVEWLQPGAVCFAGVAGYSAAIGRRTKSGPQGQSFGGRPIYVMPNPSGVNQGVTLDGLADHLRAALALASA